MIEKSISEIIDDTLNKRDAEKWREYQEDMRFEAKVRKIVRQELNNISKRRKYN